MRLAIGLGATAVVAAAALFAFSDRHIPPLEASTPYTSHMLVANMAQSSAGLVVGGEQGHILISNDDGKTWVQAQMPEKQHYAQINDIVFFNEKDGLAMGHEGLLLQTADGGKSWQERRFSEDGYGEALQSAAQLPDGRWLVIGAFGVALASADQGKTWQAYDFGVEEVSDRHLNKLISSPDKQTWLLLAESGYAVRSTDGGETWALVPSFYDGSLYGGVKLDGDDWLVYGMRGNVFRSSDNGQSWSNVALPHQFSLLNHYRDASGELYLVGLGGSIVKSTDGGKSFTEVRRGPQPALLAMTPAKDGGWMVATEEGMRHYSHAFHLDGEDEIPVEPSLTADSAEAGATNEATTDTLGEAKPVEADGVDLDDNQIDLELKAEADLGAEADTETGATE